MKYFTKGWWEAGCQSSSEVFAAYESYLASVRSNLPPALVELEVEHTLHDAEVKHIVCNFAERSVVMVLNGWNRELQYPVRYTLNFGGVAVFDQLLPQDEYVESELGDLGYWECELIRPEVKVSMLFVSGAEFRVQFTEFEFTHERRSV